MVIEDLIHEHKLILKNLEDIQNLGFEAKISREKLISFKEDILKHLKNENTLLDSYFQSKIEDIEFKKKLDKFHKELDRITIVALNFFDRYFSEIKEEDFEKDLLKLKNLLLNRLKDEVDLINEK